jgi:hypothetical protein
VAIFKAEVDSTQSIQPKLQHSRRLEELLNAKMAPILEILSMDLSSGSPIRAQAPPSHSTYLIIVVKKKYGDETCKHKEHGVKPHNYHRRRRMELRCSKGLAELQIYHLQNHHRYCPFNRKQKPATLTGLMG